MRKTIDDRRKTRRPSKALLILMEIRKRGGVVNAAIALAVGKGIVRNADLPYKDVELTKDWAK